eukprot:13839206-Alexandrium_andersonii.AAC.1
MEANGVEAFELEAAPRLLPFGLGGPVLRALTRRVRRELLFLERGPREAEPALGRRLLDHLRLREQ